MADQKFKDDDFLALWVEYGSSWTWADYASVLSDRYGLTGDARIKQAAVSTRVSRKRDKWEAERGIAIPLRRLNHAEVFASWPDLPVHMRRQSLYRWLEYESLYRQLGEEGVPPSVREVGWRTARRAMKAANELIRYDPGRQWLYRSKRTPREMDLDAAHERFWEPPESYASRHSTAG